MKKILLILFFALTASVTGAMAQKTALGERAPEVKPSAWLDGRQPASAKFTYIEFFVASNKACVQSLENLRKIADKSEMRIIVVARESEEKAAAVLSSYLSPRLGVAIDPDGKVFSAFGVTYVPFGVLTDSKNRVLWIGNTLQFTPAIIDSVK